MSFYNRELIDFIPFRLGDKMTDETRARLMTAFNWQSLVADLERLGCTAKQTEIQKDKVEE